MLQVLARTQSFQLLVLWVVASAQSFQLLVVANTQSFRLLVRAPGTREYSVISAFGTPGAE